MIVPLEGDEDRYLVFRGIRRTSFFLDGWEAASRDVLSAEAIRRLPARKAENGDVMPMSFQIVVPERAGVARGRERAARLAADLLARPRASVYLFPGADPAIGTEAAAPGDFQPAYLWSGMPMWGHAPESAE